MTEPSNQMNKLFAAIQKSDVSQVRWIISEDVAIDRKDGDGRTALTLASSIGNPDIVQLLISAGADIDIQDNEGNTALMMVELSKSTKLVKLLKQAGASQKGLKEVELLQAIERNDQDRVKALLQEKLNLNIRLGQSTMLCHAAAEGHPEIAKLLIEAGADVNQPVSEGYFNPLLYAAYGGHLEIVRILLEAGADLNVRVKDYLNPLEYAELGKYEGHSKDKPFDEVIAILESYGATRSA